jgi:predicted ester cyclase
MSDPAEIVESFIRTVRSGVNPQRAAEFMHTTVNAHQLTSEAPATVQRSPENYAAHVEEILEMFGQFTLTITEFIASSDRVYVRWQQRGMHIGDVDGFPPTGLEITELASAVYRVENGKIAEYWIQVDRAGVRAQLERNSAVTTPNP